MCIISEKKKKILLENISSEDDVEFMYAYAIATDDDKFISAINLAVRNKEDELGVTYKVNRIELLQRAYYVRCSYMNKVQEIELEKITGIKHTIMYEPVDFDDKYSSNKASHRYIFQFWKSFDHS